MLRTQPIKLCLPRTASVLAILRPPGIHCHCAVHPGPPGATMYYAVVRERPSNSKCVTERRSYVLNARVPNVRIRGRRVITRVPYPLNGIPRLDNNRVWIELKIHNMDRNGLGPSATPAAHSTHTGHIIRANQRGPRKRVCHSTSGNHQERPHHALHNV